MKFYAYTKSIFSNFLNIAKLVGKCILLIHRFIKNTATYQIESADYQKARNIYLINYGKNRTSVNNESDNYATEIYELYEDLCKEEKEKIVEYFSRKRKQQQKRKRKAKEIEFNKHISKESFTEIINHKRKTDLSEVGFDADEMRKEVEEINKKDFPQDKKETMLAKAQRKFEEYNNLPKHHKDYFEESFQGVDADKETN